MTQKIARIVLKAGEEKRIEAGKPWVYYSQIAEPAIESLEPGTVADVEAAGKKYLGRAIVNPQSKIVARLYSHSKDGLDKGFIKHRIAEAINRRILAGYNMAKDSCRIVFAEADFLPGLIADRFVDCRTHNSYLSLQFLSYGMDTRRGDILEAFNEVLEWNGGKPSAIIEKDAAVRELEGLPRIAASEELLQGSLPEGGIVISENGLEFIVKLDVGQKTGYYLDQRFNRAAAARWALELTANHANHANEFTVLDCCCNTGGFGITIAAQLLHNDVHNFSVTCIDSSSPALMALMENARLNAVDGQITAIRGDVFDELHTLEKQKNKFAMIILDPPAFTKGRATLDDAMRGYKEINLQAMKLLRKNGILVSCSCSQAMDEHRFKRMISEAAKDAGKRLYQLEFRCQSPDHPILVGYDESYYLKCGVYQVA
ncbi:MAG: class I SAM-dependent rRNA methyltransferase [Spirochaetaceae bacterium]|jgi:23S rRNA (cytosine1962-C5)-methyltransferase|nr:class I SAM-dependent rRNA methyltransferase [Spirochaetaceae bacterium]